ncbi:MAG: hypothetical protein Q8P31_00055, partial [Bacillota bacterium]|nr:hypothetical protein [Bacillota bacterium]
MAPSKRKITAEDLWRFRFPGDPQVSPDGRRLALVLTVPDEQHNGYNSSIWMAPYGGAPGAPGAPGCCGGSTPAGARQFTAGRVKDGTCRDQSPRWSPDGKKLAFL